MNTVRAFLLKCEAFFYNLCPSHSLRGKRCENVKIVTVFGRKLGQQQRGQQQKQMSQAIFGTEQCQGTSPLRNTASNSGIPPAQGREEKGGEVRRPGILGGTLLLKERQTCRCSVRVLLIFSVLIRLSLELVPGVLLWTCVTQDRNEEERYFFWKDGRESSWGWESKNKSR